MYSQPPMNSVDYRSLYNRGLEELFLSRYTEAQFLGISEKVLPKLSSGLSRFIGSQIWQNGGDIRDVISVARLIRKNDSPEQVSEIINTMMKYRSGDC